MEGFRVPDIPLPSQRPYLFYFIFVMLNWLGLFVVFTSLLKLQNKIIELLASPVSDRLNR